MNDIAEQMDDGTTAEEWRGYCKLHHGVAILKAGDEAFAEEYDRIIKPLPYEAKLKLMMEPFDFGITRRMSVKQQTQYLESVQREFAERGIQLTDPEGLLKSVQDRDA